MESSKLHFPATQRNRQVILETMQGWVGPKLAQASVYRVLEVAAGSGEHSIHLAPGLAAQGGEVAWQSTDLKPEHIASIQAWQDESENKLFAPALTLDVLNFGGHPVLDGPKVDLLYCANMIHIAPWACTDGLFALANAVVAPQGRVFLYGPFMREGRHTSPSNAAFSEGLVAQDPEWGVRELEKVESVATQHGFERCELASMPANNLSLLFRRSDPSKNPG